MIQVADNGTKLEKNMRRPGGETKDFKKVTLQYPFINTESTKNKIDNMPIGSITFKALKEGTAIIIHSNIKVVDSVIREIHHNTWYQIALNIIKNKNEPANPPEEEQKSQRAWKRQEMRNLQKVRPVN